ncbi:hypothetical protein DFH09DRAFT_1275028 [Mycena vulgaris]|nr:hypothetical protein DFH09DRAFT_1275028 [Mycena vulgaris]
MSLRNSPFAVKLQSNYVPSNEEILEIHGLLVEPLGELARLDTQIDETQDILQEIFLSCLPTEWNATVDARDTPLLLGFISRYWRSVAHSMPLLWSGLHIDWQKPGGFFPPPDFIDAWLNRAGTCPLFIFLGLPEYYYDGGQYEGVEPIINASHRIQRLELLDGIVPPIFRPLLQLGAEDLPALTKFKIDTGSDLNGLNLLLAPSLRHISLDVTLDPLSLPLVWGQLTDLTIGAEQDIPSRPGSRRCQNLVRGHLHLRGSNRLTARPAFTVPHLQHLTLVLKAVNSPAEFMVLLSLPNLRHLAILYGQDRGSDPGTSQIMTPAEYFPPASGTPHFLVDLSLRHFTQTTLLSFFDLFPRVTRLRLRGRHESLNGGFLSRLTPTVEGPSHHLCSSLTHLEISASCVFSDATVLDFIQSHSIHGPSLQRIHIDFHRNIEIDILPELQPLISEGLTVDLIWDAWNDWSGWE